MFWQPWQGKIGFYKLFRLKPRLAVWAFDQFFRAAQGNCRNNKKQRQKTHSRFFGKLRDRAAPGTANHIGRFARAPGKIFCADD